MMALYLRLRYRGPCLGGQLLATGTKLQRSRMQTKHGAKKQKKTKMEAMLKQRHNNGKQISQWNDGQVWHSERHTRSMSPPITISYSKK